MTVVSVHEAAKAFRRKGFSIPAVVSGNLAVQRGEIVALVGQSGSGKSTLLNLLLGWEQPDRGSIEFDGAAGGPQTRRWDEVAVLPQALALLEDLTVEENILLPARARRRERGFTARARELGEQLGIAHLALRFPTQISLGEQQRTAFARAVLLSPALVIADEPTAHQDARSTQRMLELMHAQARAGSAFLVATHDSEVSSAADRVVRMSEGVLQAEDVR